jgi:magnesium transporter
MSKTQIGMPPGSLVYTGNTSDDTPSHLSLFEYNEKMVYEHRLHAANEIKTYRQTDLVTWVNLDGLHDIGLVEQLGEHFGIHSLLLEDILNIEQRPKAEDFDTYLFFTLKALNYNSETRDIETEQISFVLGHHYLVSFQEAENGDIFEPVRERIRKNKGKLRTSGADYLVYRLLDTVVDNYFDIVDRINDRIDILEESVFRGEEPHSLTVDIQRLKKDLIQLRKSLIPLRQAIEDIQHSDERLIRPATLNYFRDVQDHIMQVIEEIESAREILLGVLEMYHTNQGNRMNNIMKVLTIVSAIFVPLTFIAGLYGMNFKYIPELETHNGYFICLAAMFVVGASMSLWFWYKKWL